MSTVTNEELYSVYTHKMLAKFNIHNFRASKLLSTICSLFKRKFKIELQTTELYLKCRCFGNPSKQADQFSAVL